MSSLSTTQQSILENQLFSEKQPGSLMANFSTFIDFVGTDGISVSRVNHLIPIKHLNDLDAALSHKVEIHLKRPVQKSYPYINGLYLLLRVSGLSYIMMIGKTPYLLIDEEVQEKWSKLNSTEQYFVLLQAWWTRGSTEIMGEERQTGSLMFSIEGLFYQKLLEQDVIPVGKRPGYDEEILRFLPGHYYLALMKLFGFLEIQSGQPDEGKGWKITQLSLTEWGRVILKTFFKLTETYWRDSGSLENEEDQRFEKWRKIIQPYIKMWKQTLDMPIEEISSSNHIFKISLGKVWRRIAISGENNFEQFAQVILDAFDFDDDHLHQFIYKNRYGQRAYINHPNLDAWDNTRFGDEVFVGELHWFPGMSCTFIFDFGDHWEFDILFESCEDISLEKDFKILEKKGKAPQQYRDMEEWD